MKELVLITPENASSFRPIIRESAYPHIADEDTAALGLADDSVPFGAIVFRISDPGTAELLSIYVRPEYRRQGFASELMSEMGDYLEAQTEVTRVVCDYDLREDVKSSIPDFLSSFEFEISEKPGGCFVTTFEDLRAIRDLAGGADDVTSYGDLTTMQKKLLYDEDIDLKPDMDSGAIEETISCVKLEDGKIPACLLFTADETDPDSLYLLWARNDGTPVQLLQLFRHVVSASESFAGEKKLYIPVLNERSEKLAAGLLGDRARKIETAYHAELALYDPETIPEEEEEG
ncbi:MAG: GNAT family N-acetyltransferase [Lachnospiraceae bacterium]|nr:GNAT family N-acetyltransferase [Lachnospiraceae bacterium]